jgi:hypothetical protein
VRLVRFEDLKFINHPVSLGRLGKRIQAKGEINGKWYSVVGGANLCGDGINTFEMWTEKMENEESGPAPYISKEEVEIYIKKKLCYILYYYHLLGLYRVLCPFISVISTEEE